MWGRGKCREGLSRMSSEGQRIWSIKIGWANIINHHIKFHPSDDFLDISDTTHPNLAIDSLWLTQPWGSIPLLIESSHRIKSSFHLYPIFPMMSHCVSFYYSFSFWFIIWFVMLFYDRTFWKIPMTHWWEIAYRSQKCCLVIQDSPMYIRRLSCLRERIKFRIYS